MNPGLSDSILLLASVTPEEGVTLLEIVGANQIMLLGFLEVLLGWLHGFYITQRYTLKGS